VIEGWAVGTIGQLARVRSGFAFKSSQWTDDGVPVVKIGNVKRGRLDMEGSSFVTEDDAKQSGFLLSEGDILIGLTGYVGEVAKVRGFGPLVLNQRVGKFYPTSRCEPDFLFFLVSNEEFRQRVEAASHGSAQANVSPTAIEALEVAIPPLPEQRAIAATLGALDDKIELNRKMNATLEAMARALFRDWFVDFGPTRAKIEARAPYLSPDLWPLFPDRLDDEGKPEGWEAGTMSDLFTLQRGFDLPSQDRRDGKYPILAASGPSGYHESNMVKGPGVTTGRSGVLGRVFYVHDDFWALNTSLWVKDYKRATPLYAYQFLSFVDLAGFNAGSAVPTLNRNHIHGLPAVLPPRKLVVEFDKLAHGLMSRHRHNEVENETLAQTRDLLLPRLMSGELRVAEVEAAL
jgi:type I restriction enzyme S subunit